MQGLPQPNGTQLLIWLACAASALGAVSFLLMLFNQAAKARQTLAGKRDGIELSPQPLKVAAAKIFALETDCRERHATLDARINAAIESGRLEHQRLYDQIDVVERRSEDKLAGSMSEMREVIRKLPQEVVDLLHKTGQLKRDNQ